MGHAAGISEGTSELRVRQRIAVLVPTFNEPAVLRDCIGSLLAQTGQDLDVIVINAGDPLPSDIRSRITELNVPADHYWTACIDNGLRFAISRSAYTHIMLLNADNAVFPDAAALLLAEAVKDDNTVVCCAAYTHTAEGDLETVYTHQEERGKLLLFRLCRAWANPCDAPERPFTTANAGGQGTLFSIKLLSRVWPDVARFPHYMGDTDLWLQVRRAGGQLVVVPKAGAVNLRPFRHTLGATRRERLRSVWWKFTSPNSLDSLVIVWRLRRKHLGLPRAIKSFAFVVPLRFLEAGYHFLRFDNVERARSTSSAKPT